MNRRRILCGLLVVCGLLCSGERELSAAPLRSFTVEQFNEVYKKLVGRDVRVTGRKSLVGRREIGLSQCDVRFKSRHNLPKFDADVENLRIDGRLAMEGRRYVVYITSVRERPSDAEEFENRRRQLDDKVLEGWYELGDWAAGLGRFYQDAKMNDLAMGAYKQAISLEHKEIQGKDPRALKKLAAKAKEYGLSDSLREEMIFEAYVVTRSQAKTLDQLGRAISAASADLPGSDKPLAQPEADLRQRYERKPVETYRDSTGFSRKVLHRMLMTDLILARVKSQLDENYQNGFEIADLIETEIPEYKELAKEYRDRALQMRTEQVATLSRKQILDLKSKYEEQQQPQKGREAVEAWLEHRLNRLDEQDTEGLLSLAEDYVALVDRRERAAQLLLDAYKQAPQSEEIAARLERLGYRQEKGEWTNAREPGNENRTEMERAVAEGRPMENMTASQLLKAIGAPSKVLRIASRDEVVEYWLYQQSKESEVAIQLSRPRGEAEARVLKLDQMKVR